MAARNARQPRRETGLSLGYSRAAMTRRTTFHDVARAAGVSKATVSRVLNGRSALLTPELAERVQAAIESLDYSPSPMAQSLKRGRSGLIGLVVADVTNPFSVAVLRGVEQACRDAGYMVMLFNLGNDDARERDAVRALSSYQVEGYLLHTLGHDAAPPTGTTPGERADGERAHGGKPVVLIDRALDDASLDLVGLDNSGALRLAAGHLVDAGYRRLLFVSEPVAGLSSREERADAFRAVVGEPSSGVHGEVLEVAPGDDARLDAALQALIARAAGVPAAVIAVNAIVTLRVAAAAARLAWTLGRDLGLVGFDDPEWAPLVGPGLTTIAQPTDEIGRLAVRCLLDRIAGARGAGQRIRLPGRLVVRGSSRRD
jgi:LacI family kdg operon repressor